IDFALQLFGLLLLARARLLGLSLQLCLLLLGAARRRDVAREFHDLGHAPALVQNRRVDGAQPDFATIFGDALDLAILRFPAVELRPEALVLEAGCVRRLAEDAVMAPADF